MSVCEQRSPGEGSQAGLGAGNEALAEVLRLSVGQAQGVVWVGVS